MGAYEFYSVCCNDWCTFPNVFVVTILYKGDDLIKNKIILAHIKKKIQVKEIVKTINYFFNII